MNDFKEPFQSVVNDRSENNLVVIESAMREVVDLKNDSRTKEGNEFLNKLPERKEI